MDGVPLLPIPTYEEVGLPAFTMPTGTPSTGADASGGGGGGTSTAALEEMRSRSWGIAAAANAEALGVDPAAVAGAGLIESDFRNVAASGGGTISGVFRRTTYGCRARTASPVGWAAASGLWPWIGVDVPLARCHPLMVSSGGHGLDYGTGDFW